MKNKMVITAKAKGICRTVPASMIIEVVLEVVRFTHEEALDAVNNALQELSQKMVMDNIGKLFMVGNPSVKDDSLVGQSAERSYRASVACKIECDGVNPIIVEEALNRIKSSKNIVSIESHYELDADQFNSLSTLCINDCYRRAKKRAIDLYKIANALSSTENLVVTSMNSSLEDIVFGDYPEYYVQRAKDTVTSDACICIEGIFKFEIYEADSKADGDCDKEAIFVETNTSDGVPMNELTY